MLRRRLRRRERHRLTQGDAAPLIHMTANAWEQGTRKMDRRTWELLQYKLGDLAFGD